MTSDAPIIARRSCSSTGSPSIDACGVRPSRSSTGSTRGDAPSPSTCPGHGESPDAASTTSPRPSSGSTRSSSTPDSSSPCSSAIRPAPASSPSTPPSTRPAGIVEVDGSVLVAPIRGAQLTSVESGCVGDGFEAAWARVATSVFGLDDVSDGVRAFVEATSRPRREVVIPSWNGSPHPVDGRAGCADRRRGRAIRSRRHPGRPRSSAARPRPTKPPGTRRAPARRPHARLAGQWPLPAPGVSAPVRRAPRVNRALVPKRTWPSLAG